MDESMVEITNKAVITKKMEQPRLERKCTYEHCIPKAAAVVLILDVFITTMETYDITSELEIIKQANILCFMTHTI